MEGTLEKGSGGASTGTVELKDPHIERTDITELMQQVPTEEMEKLLKWHGQSDDVMVVRYHQEGCTACNALDKVFEYHCHEAKK